MKFSTKRKIAGHYHSHNLIHSDVLNIVQIFFESLSHR